MSSRHHRSIQIEEKRSYFRVDDVIPIIATHVQDCRCIGRSRILSLSEIEGLSTTDVYTSLDDRQRLSKMLMDINTKLDFIINYLLLEKEGLLSAEKKPVNISAAGIRFSVSFPVKVGDVIEVKLLLPTCPPTALLLYGKVKRVKDLEDGTYEVALQYLNMTDSVRDEIIQYTLNHQREMRRAKDVNPV